MCDENLVTMKSNAISDQKNYIIIADDDRDDQELLEAALTELNFPLRINMASDGVDLLEQLKLNSMNTRAFPSLIILDINMPRKNGVEVLKEIKDNSCFRHIPVIMYSTSANNEAKTGCYALGASLYIRKPASHHELNEVAMAIRNLWMEMVRTSVV